MSTPKTQHDSGIETLRGLAVLLMVAGHVVGVDDESGLRVRDDSWWRHLYYSLAPLRMPLFTGISGFVYALRPATAPGWPRFMAGKLRRLLIPLLVVGSAFIVTQMIVSGANGRVEFHNLAQSMIIPRTHFWYLYALAWVFLVVGTFDAVGLLERRWQLLLLLTGALALRAFGPLATPIFGIWHAQYLLPYFLVGLGVQRFPLRSGWPHAMTLFGLGAAGMALYQCHWFGWRWPSDPVEYAVVTLLGAVGISGCLHYRVPWRPLAVLGSFSYGIYLMHVFGTAGARILLQRAGVESLPLLALAGLISGLAFPIAVERAIERRPGLALLVLGRRRAPPEPPAPAERRAA